MQCRGSAYLAIAELFLLIRWGTYLPGRTKATHRFHNMR
jgi:hypothetical protein